MTIQSYRLHMAVFVRFSNQKNVYLFADSFYTAPIHAHWWLYVVLVSIHAYVHALVHAVIQTD